MQCPNPRCAKTLPAHIHYCPYCGALVSPQPVAPFRQRGWALWFWWVLANAMGWAAITVVGQDMAGAVLGPVAGVAQWLVLRRQVQRAGWWVLASTMGWGMAVITQGIPVGWVVGLSMAGAVVGAITGIALVWLL